jgi:serine/threonine-protein kinase
MIVGTPAYMAPEQLAGAEATPQSDLYSVGVMLHELLTGHRPFDAPSMGDLLARIARQPAPRVTERRPDLPPLIDDIVARLLAKSPDARHRDGRQLAIELQVAQSTLVAAPPAPPPSSPAVTTQPMDLQDEDDAVDPFAPTMPAAYDEDLPLSDAQSERLTPPQVPSSSPSS